ncbi:MAG TPA: sulfite exporter TauE/SafE family protein [Candidatus Limnocylindria bacterium]|nr:sulfite exporter TauE/SafE family protein [Candidatus Limnocylindria bacterium]
MDPAHFLAASLVIAAGSFVQGGVGFGSLLIAAPLLVLVDPRLVPGPVLLPGLALAVLMALRDRAGMHLGGVGWALAGRVPGSVVGALVLAALPGGAFELLVGATVIVGALATASGLRLHPTRLVLFVAGFVAGITGTTTSIGGPPIALVYQHHTGSTLRGTLSGFFVAGSLLSMLTLALVGHFGARELLLGLALLPGTVAGFAVSPPFVRWLDRGYTRAAVLVLSMAAGAALIVRRLA